MQLTPQMLKERIAALAGEREQAIAQVNALSGAIQDCEYWLTVCDAEPEK